MAPTSWIINWNNKLYPKCELGTPGPASKWQCSEGFFYIIQYPSVLAQTSFLLTNNSQMFILIWTKGNLLLVRSWTGKSNKKYLKTVIVLWSLWTHKLLLWPTSSVFCLYLYLSFSHNLVCDLSVLFALLHFAAALLVAEQPQRLRALQFNLKLLVQEQNKCLLGFSRVHICVNFWISLSIQWRVFFELLMQNMWASFLLQ